MEVELQLASMCKIKYHKSENSTCMCHQNDVYKYKELSSEDNPVICESQNIKRIEIFGNTTNVLMRTEWTINRISTAPVSCFRFTT